PDLSEWKRLVEKNKFLSDEIKIGIVGKYTELRDSYISSMEALEHAGISQNVKVKIKLIHAKDISATDCEKLFGLDGILIPGGYGQRDAAGIIHAIRYARENKIPFLGIGLGMQCALIEFTRNVMNRPEADTAEFNSAAEMLLIEHITKPTNEKSLPKRKGAHPCKLNKNSLTFAAYNEEMIHERFCHLYKVNNFYRAELTNAGIIEAAVSEDGAHLEAFELPKEMHPWFVGVQFHPELKSRITRPSPLVTAFVNACVL
ncbi:MAG: gamma-glutamyl-gamma-aminobutyrate hydrolase family protein, partial [Defluviitaleaceae bacterium]|nr:gamma-glutamyl-gamma-aminobutyrate hydrolase family protein [Defluviitaleaceae bacterium]